MATRRDITGEGDVPCPAQQRIRTDATRGAEVNRAGVASRRGGRINEGAEGVLRAQARVTSTREDEHLARGHRLTVQVERRTGSHRNRVDRVGAEGTSRTELQGTGRDGESAREGVGTSEGQNIGADLGPTEGERGTVGDVASEGDVAVATDGRGGSLAAEADLHITREGRGAGAGIPERGGDELDRVSRGGRTVQNEVTGDTRLTIEVDPTRAGRGEVARGRGSERLAERDGRRGQARDHGTRRNASAGHRRAKDETGSRRHRQGVRASGASDGKGVR